MGPGEAALKPSFPVAELRKLEPKPGALYFQRNYGVRQRSLDQTRAGAFGQTNLYNGCRPRTHTLAAVTGC